MSESGKKIDATMKPRRTPEELRAPAHSAGDLHELKEQVTDLAPLLRRQT